ncbi:ATS1 [[Candida] subhashii]|uniref:ATS1 n=1 Tax=[Candida] subhashii TaxID=561895 RepID=A0A8J5QU18_9ASCO|nr:ATS1 [[Candida] subhashii]KAG7662560.1 ATS1 [[Candida] subhashii]
MYKVLACGSNGNYQLGIRNDIDQNILQESQFQIGQDSIVTSLPQKPIKIACGGNHTLILFENGDIYSTGENQYGQCGLPKCGNIKLLTKIPGNWIDCCCGWEFSILIDDKREVYVCGNGLKGELGLGKEIRQSELCFSFAIPTDSNFEIKASIHHVILRIDNILMGWGNCRKGQLGIIDEKKPSILWQPRELNFPNIIIRKGTTKFTLGREFTCISNEDRISIFGKHSIELDSDVSDVLEIGSMWSSLHILLKNNTIRSFGNNSHGQLYPTVSDFKVDEMVIGSEHGLVNSSNTVYSWGWGEHGNCGIQQQGQSNADEVTFNYLNPVYTDSSEVVLVAAGCATSWVVIKVE